MIRLQRLAQIAITGHGSLIDHQVCTRVARINRRTGNEHVIRRSIAFPRDRSIRITGINADLRDLVHRLAVLHRHVVQEEEVIAVKITHKSQVSTVTIVRTEVHDVLLESLITPYAHGIHRTEGSDILRILHHTDHDTTAVLTTGIGIDR